jgi:hypothetical protein
MSNVAFRFTAPTGFSPTLSVYRADTGVLLGAAEAVEATAPNHYSATVNVGSYVGDVIASLENPDGAFFGSTSDPVLRSDKQISLADITAAVEAAGITLTDANIAAIALGVFRRLTGGSAAIGQLAGAVHGGPLDAINSADFNYTASIETNATSTIIFSIRRCVDDAVPQLEADSTDGLTILTGVDAPTGDQAVITRISGTQVSITILAAAIAALTPGTYASEIRELTTDNETLSKLELPIIIRRSASRRTA